MYLTEIRINGKNESNRTEPRDDIPKKSPKSKKLKKENREKKINDKKLLIQTMK